MGLLVPLLLGTLFIVFGLNGYLEGPTTYVGQFKESSYSEIYARPRKVAYETLMSSNPFKENLANITLHGQMYANDTVDFHVLDWNGLQGLLRNSTFPEEYRGVKNCTFTVMNKNQTYYAVLDNRRSQEGKHVDIYLVKEVQLLLFDYGRTYPWIAAALTGTAFLAVFVKKTGIRSVAAVWRALKTNLRSALLTRMCPKRKFRRFLREELLESKSDPLVLEVIALCAPPLVSIVVMAMSFRSRLWSTPFANVMVDYVVRVGLVAYSVMLLSLLAVLAMPIVGSPITDYLSFRINKKLGLYEYYDSSRSQHCTQIFFSKLRKSTARLLGFILFLLIIQAVLAITKTPLSVLAVLLETSVIVSWLGYISSVALLEAYRGARPRVIQEAENRQVISISVTFSLSLLAALIIFPAILLLANFSLDGISSFSVFKQVGLQPTPSAARAQQLQGYSSIMFSSAAAALFLYCLFFFIYPMLIRRNVRGLLLASVGFPVILVSERTLSIFFGGHIANWENSLLSAAVFSFVMYVLGKYYDRLFTLLEKKHNSHGQTANR